METATYLAELLVWSTAHLVWQAALACAVFRLWSSTRSPSAEERHTVALAMLASLPILVIATALVTHLSLVLNAREGSVGALSAHSSESLGRLSAVFERAVAALPALIAIWCGGAALGIARIIRERRELRALSQRLRRASPEVIARVEALAARVGVSGRTRVLVGDFASGAPFVAGAKRPLLVLPAVKLTHDEWNAVILHELAHVRRRDYAVNHAVQILTSLLWFHPSVRLLARWAAHAREECCDAEAARLSASPIALARALVRIAERETCSVRAVAATGGSLAGRVERVLALSDGRAAGRGSVVAPLLIACAVCACGIAVCGAVAPSLDSLAISGASAAALPAERILIHAVDPAGRFTLTALNGRVAMATIGGVAVDRRALRVEGERVTILSAAGAPALSLNFDPRGSLTWEARRPATKATARE